MLLLSLFSFKVSLLGMERKAPITSIGTTMENSFANHIMEALTTPLAAQRSFSNYLVSPPVYAEPLLDISTVFEPDGPEDLGDRIFMERILT